jgi:hypothetical protein
MPTTTADESTAELLAALRAACPDVADETFAAVAAMLGVPPEGIPTPPAGEGSTDALRWEHLVLGDIPGLKELLSVVSSPLQVIAAILDFLAGILDILSALLLDILDPMRALVLAAYEILRSIIEDLLNSGAYLYADLVGLPFPAITRPVLPASGDKPPWIPGGPPLAVPPRAVGFDAWAARFKASFDDPGDLQRPTFSTGAPVEAVFIVGTAPDLAGAGGLLKLLEMLFDVKSFGKAWDSFAKTFPASPPDPQRARARQKSAAPDWRSWRLRDIAPPDYPLEKLMWLPWLLKALLLNVDGIIGLLRKLAAAVKEKANMLRRLVAILQAIIDAIQALAATGLHVLTVTTDSGVEGLTQAFLSAQDRPGVVIDADGTVHQADLVAGVCLLAGTTSVLPIWGLLGHHQGMAGAYSSLIDQGKALGAEAEKRWADTKALATGAWEGTGTPGTSATSQGARQLGVGLWEKLRATGEETYNNVLHLLGLTDEQVRTMSEESAAQLAAMLGQLSVQGRVRLDPRVLAHIEASRRAGETGNRSLAAGARLGH